MKKRLWRKGISLALSVLLLAGCSTAEGESSSAGPNTGSDAGSTSVQGEPSSQGGAAPDVAEPEQMEVTLYLPNESADGFEETAETVEASPQGIVDALIAQGALPEGVVVNRFQTEDSGAEGQDGEGASGQAGDTTVILLDLSEEFSAGVNRMGSSGEALMLGSLVNTMLTAYEADAVMLTCGGAVLETGHNVYDAPISFVEMS